MRFLRAMGTGGGSPSPGKRQLFPPRPKGEQEVQGRKQHQWSPAFLRDLSGPGQGRGTRRRKRGWVAAGESSRKMQEEGITGRELSLRTWRMGVTGKEQRAWRG